MTAATPPAPGADSPAGSAGVAVFGFDVPFMDHIGLRGLSLQDGVCRTRLPFQPALTNSRGDVHGGTLMAAFDFTLSVAARAHEPDRWGVVTVDMNTHFLEPARGELTLESRCLRRGRSMAFCEAEALDAQGTVVAVARGVFKLVPRAPRPA